MEPEGGLLEKDEMMFAWCPCFCEWLRRRAIRDMFSATRKKILFQDFRAGFCTRLGKPEVGAWAAAGPHPVLPSPPQHNRSYLRERGLGALACRRSRFRVERGGTQG